MRPNRPPSSPPPLQEAAPTARLLEGRLMEGLPPQAADDGPEPPALPEADLEADRSSPALARAAALFRDASPPSAHPDEALARLLGELGPSELRPESARAAHAGRADEFRVASPPRRLHARSRAGWAGAGLAAMALAAGLALAWRGAPEPAPEPSPSAVTPVAALVDAAGLSPSQRLGTHDMPLVVEGRAGGRVVTRWLLGPRSLVDIRERAAADGRGQVVALAEGSVHAQVARGLGEGAFTVVADGVRATAKGTIFEVRRAGSDVLVAVHEGVVRVTGAAGSVEVNAGREARVSVADAKLLSEAESPAPAGWVASQRLAELVPIDGPALAPAPPSGEAQPPFGSASASGVAPAPRPAHAATHGPTASAKAAPTTTNDGALRAALRACFDQSHPAAPDGARVAVASTLHLTLRPDGTVSTARFDPPLSPAFQACATKSVLAPHAAGTPSHTLGLSFP